jgi:hypothetical protein
MGEFVRSFDVVPRTTVEQRMGAIASCAAHSMSVADLAELLSVLGLDTSPAEIVESLTPRMAEQVAETRRLQVELAQVYDHLASLVLAIRGRWSSKWRVAGQVAGALRDLDRVREYLESLQSESEVA